MKIWTLTFKLAHPTHQVREDAETTHTFTFCFKRDFQYRSGMEMLRLAIYALEGMASVKNHGNENGIYTCHERAMKIYKLKMK
jgi:hypothetical protein